MDPLRQSHQLSRTPTTLTNDDIEAVIQMATSSRPSPDGRSGPLKDTRTQLFVGNLPYRVRWQDLKDLFRRAGTVLRADVSLGPDNRSRGYGTVLLATAEDAGRAIDIFNGYSWQTRILEVRPDRLPPDFDASIAPHFPPAPNQHPSLLSRHSEDLDISAMLDLHHNFPGASSNPCRNLFVGNLPFHCQWQDLKDLFRQAGTIMRADVALGQDGRSRGFGTVVFATELDAERAVKMFNGYEYNGRALKVNFDKFTQVGLPTSLVPNNTGTSGVGSSMSPVSPAMSYTSATVDHRISAPAPYHSRQLPSHTQPAKLGYPLDLDGTSSGSASPLDIWGLSLQKREKDREDREKERDVLHSFHHLDIRSRTSSGLSSQVHSAPAASRSTSTSSSVKPPSLGQTSSSGSGISSSSSVAASVSTSSTSEKSNPPSVPLPPPPPPRHHRISSSQARNLVAPTSSSSSSPSLLQSRQQNSQQSTSSHHPHPHHPGTISLPPPPHVTSFPLHPHNMSPHGPHGMMGMSISPLHHPLGSPSSPLFHPHQLQLQQQHLQQQHQLSTQMQVPITPHGLPPITPSMPPFNFLPPLGSPTTTNPNMPSQQAYQSYSQHALPSPPIIMPMHLHTPASPLHSAHDQFQLQQKQAHDQQQRQQQVQQQQQQRALGAFSLAGINPFTFSQPSPSGAANGDNSFTPGVNTFSPGVAMSPGAFWGRPGAGGTNPMINPAVGAPVHPHAGSPGHGGLFYPAVGGGGGMREPAGYFDSGYFPPMGGGAGGLGASGLANEILKDPKERGIGEREENKEGEKDHTDIRREEDKEEGVDSSLEGDTSEDGAELETRGEKVRRHSSTTKTAWQATSAGDLRVWEGREAGEGRGDIGIQGGKAQESEAGAIDNPVISRTHSMTSSKKPAGLFHRSESDPPPVNNTGVESGRSSTEDGRPPLAKNATEDRQVLEPNADQRS